MKEKHFFFVVVLFEYDYYYNGRRPVRSCAGWGVSRLGCRRVGINAVGHRGVSTTV